MGGAREGVGGDYVTGAFGLVKDLVTGDEPTSWAPDLRGVLIETFTFGGSLQGHCGVQDS